MMQRTEGMGMRKRWKNRLLLYLFVAFAAVSACPFVPGAVYASTINRYPTLNAAAGTVTSPTNAYDDNNVGAIVSANNSTLEVYGYDSTNLGTISDVTVWVKYKTTAAPIDDTYQFDVDLDGNWATTGDTYSIVAANPTNQPTYVLASTSLIAITWAQVGTLKVRCKTVTTGGADAYNVDWDVGYLVVTFCDKTIDATCTECHGTPPLDGARNWSTGAVVGSHQRHAGAGITACTTCHTDNGTNQNHRNGNINMAAAINTPSGSYSKGTSFPQVGSPTLGNCSNTNCHGAASPTWGANTTNDGCTKCHGTPTASPAADMYKAPPFDLAGGSLNTDPEVGAHRAHLNSPAATTHSISSPIICNQCHTVPAQANDPGHFDTGSPAELNFGSLANKSGALTPSFSYATEACNNTYCHGASLPEGDKPPTWNVPMLTGVATNDCTKCHGYPPATATHTGKDPAVPGTCAGCHNHVNNANTGFSNIVLHVNGAIEGGSCKGCHSVIQDKGDGPPTRRAVITEFDTAAPWVGHLDYDVSAAADSTLEADCHKCHAEPVTNHQNNTLDSANAFAFASDAFCLDCHKAAVAAPFSDGVVPPDINTAWTRTYNHDKVSPPASMNVDCISCHGKENDTDNGHVSTNRRMLKHGTYPYKADGVTLWSIDDFTVGATRNFNPATNTQINGATGTLQCLLCHTFGTGTTWNNNVHMEHDNGGGYSYTGNMLACVVCHAAHPHGTVNPALIVYAGTPAPDSAPVTVGTETINGLINVFTRAATPTGYNTGNCKITSSTTFPSGGPDPCNAGHP